MKFLSVIALVASLGLQVRAETVECKGRSSSSSNLELQIEFTFETHQGSIRYQYDDGTGYRQGLTFEKRKYPSSKQVTYYKDRETKTLLTLEDRSASQSRGYLTHYSSDSKGLVMDCKVSGQVPPAPVCPKDLKSSLQRAITDGKEIDDLEFLIQCGADINASYKNKCTPLMMALEISCGGASSDLGSPLFGSVRSVTDFILNSGAIVNIADSLGQTPLMKAAKSGLYDLYDLFVAAEADFDAQDKWGNTPLMYGVLSENVLLVEQMLDGNPNRRLKNRKGFTAFDLAKGTGNSEIMNLVRIPDVSIAVQGQADGSCSPLNIQMKSGQVAELTLTAGDKMFKLVSKGLGINLMADPKTSVKQTFVANSKGSFPFTCGFHGAGAPSQGIIDVQ